MIKSNLLRNYRMYWGLYLTQDLHRIPTMRCAWLVNLKNASSWSTIVKYIFFLSGSSVPIAFFSFRLSELKDCSERLCFHLCVVILSYLWGTEIEFISVVSGVIAIENNKHLSGNSSWNWRIASNKKKRYEYWTCDYSNNTKIYHWQLID